MTSRKKIWNRKRIVFAAAITFIVLIACCAISYIIPFVQTKQPSAGIAEHYRHLTEDARQLGLAEIPRLRIWCEQKTSTNIIHRTTEGIFYAFPYVICIQPENGGEADEERAFAHELGHAFGYQKFRESDKRWPSFYWFQFSYFSSQEYADNIGDLIVCEHAGHSPQSFCPASLKK